MGFSVSIMSKERIQLPHPNCTSEEFATKYNGWWEEHNWNYDDMVIDDWCSAGNVWFKHLDKYVTPISEGFYVINKDNYSQLVEYATLLMDKIALKPYFIDKSLTYIDREDTYAGYICKPIDGIAVYDDEGNSKSIWSVEGDDDCDFLGNCNLNYSEYYAVHQFIKAVFKLSTKLNDGHIVWINGGW